ncbi:hypothetical protein DH2020_036522 [Rehmannia glutinosa]|uniref:CUE domain-containing protein n=1 Tax=Rehmannia glutinosa TaxID=99300 RepID=A0ABR0V5Z0_REHGL
MKPGSSSLNPYAASYVPLFRRGVTNVSSGQELNSGIEVVWFGHQPDNTLPQGQHQNVSQSYGHSAAIQTAEFSKRKDHHGGEFFASTSQYPNAIQPNFDEEFDMDLAYLQMTFPGISYESLSDVYSASKFDLDAAVDMLNQLEIYPDDSSDKLPDTLDIGDVPESVSVGELASQKVKNPTAEGGASTSGSSNISSTS